MCTGWQYWLPIDAGYQIRLCRKKDFGPYESQCNICSKFCQFCELYCMYHACAESKGTKLSFLKSASAEELMNSVSRNIMRVLQCRK